MRTMRIAFGRRPQPTRRVEPGELWAGITIDDDYVSETHCEVLLVRSDPALDVEVFMVRDLGSTNGTWIISPSPAGHTMRKATPGALDLLAHGDRIRIGRTTLPWLVDQ